MPWISHLGDSGAIWILLAAVFLLLGKREGSKGIQILLALLLSLLFCNLILKSAVGRIRPFVFNPAVELLVPPPMDPSFPSGHTSASFAAATVLLATKWKGRWVALGLAVLIAFSRLYLYVHFPSDVVGGMGVGILCGLLAVTIWNHWLCRFVSQRKNKGMKDPP